MDFTFSEAQQHWHDATLKFAREELVEPGPDGRPTSDYGFWREGFARCAQGRHRRAAGP